MTTLIAIMVIGIIGTVVCLRPFANIDNDYGRSERAGILNGRGTGSRK